MRDFEDSTLWRVSAFERVQHDTGTSGFMRLEGPTMLSTTLTGELQRLERDPDNNDVLEVLAACLRNREPALLYLRHEDMVWPVTIFPWNMLYHCPRDFATASAAGMADLMLLGSEAPGVRPPGDWMHERIARADHYRPLVPMLWAVALYGPRAALLTEIGGTAAYRVLNREALRELEVPGALGSALERLRRESAALRSIAGWPGMSVERASRLLNALYLASALLVTHTHPAARTEPGLVRRLLHLGTRH
ncbi:MAG: hypothetical protein E6H79_13740 [Betaproteobacteria bacterium]|nr:MAG: hypothetical protein E6H79_13740 [Betaproteobacteria bacterium]